MSAAVICLLAATVLAAGSLYGSAVSLAGLRRAIVDAPPADGTILVTGSIRATDVAAIDPLATRELESTIEAGTILRTIGSTTYALPDQPADAVRALATLGVSDALADHSSLVAGTWPTDGSGRDGVIPIAVSTEVADRLGLAVGRRLTLESRLDPGTFVTVELVGIYRIADVGDPFWGNDPQLLEGRTTSDQFDTHGPFFTTEPALLAAAGQRRVSVTWRAQPDAGALTIDDVATMRDRVADLSPRLTRVANVGLTVKTGLGDLLARTERSLLVARSGVLLLTIQLVVLAAYAALLSASLLVEHRRVGTAMIRSRGAGTSSLAALALIEGLFLTVGAALVAPFLAAAVLRLFNVTGPLADVGMTIQPGVTADAFLAAAGGAAICLAALVLPAFRNARSIAAVQGEAGRGQTRSVVQRVGLDIALIAIAALGLWQLRLYGAPLTRSVQGSIGLDPLLVATPAIGLLAGAVVALRLVPLLAELLERLTRRRRGLVATLGSRQLARRPLRYSRAALLLVLAMAIGVFAVSYTWTWTRSQRDQAAFRVAADVQVTPGSGKASLPRWSVNRAYRSIPGVTAAMPVDRDSVPTTRGSRVGTLLALDAAAAPDVIGLRPDLADRPFADLMTSLVVGRQDVTGVSLPGDPARLRIVADVEIQGLKQAEFDQETGEIKVTSVPYERIAGWPGLTLSVLVRDASGVLQRFDAVQPATIDPGSHQLVVDLRPAGAPTAGLVAPVELFALEVGLSLKAPYAADRGTVSLGDVSIAGDDGTWHPVSIDRTAGWSTTQGAFGAPNEHPPAPIHGPILRAAAELGASEITFDTAGGGGADFTFAPAELGTVADAPLPIVASDAFLTATGAKAGDRISLAIAGAPHVAVVSGTVRAVPGTDPADPTAIVDLPTLDLLRFETTGQLGTPDEWWLSVDPAAQASVMRALTTIPIASQSVVSQADEGRTLAADPVALGVIGALAIGFVAAAVFAVVGFIVSASVSARERVTEFALLRALGLSSRQLSVWLSLENAVLAVVSLVAGTLLGLLLAWLVLPFITVTQGATTPYPPVDVEVPWGLIAILVAAGALALAATVASLAWLLPRIGLADVLRMSED
jgi:FtsX-like permease family protein